MERPDTAPDARPHVLLLRPPPPYLEPGLADAYVLHRLYDARDPGARLSEVGPNVRALVVGGGVKVSSELLDSLPGLEIVAVHGVGADGVDRAETERRGVAVTITDGTLTEDVADLAIGLWLAVERQIVAGDRHVRSGRWAEAADLPLARRATGRRIGILGFGQIGQAIADRARPFAGELRYHSRRPIEGAEAIYESSAVALATASDVLFVVTPGGPATRRLVDAAVIDALGPQGVLVNVSRGSVVDEQALITALAAGRLGGAGLDVFEQEPTRAEALAAMDNVVLQPHRGSATVEARTAMAASVLRSLADHFAGA